MDSVSSKALDIAESYDMELRILTNKFLAANFFTQADAVEKLADRMKDECAKLLPSSESEGEANENQWQTMYEITQVEADRLRVMFEQERAENERLRAVNDRFADSAAQTIESLRSQLVEKDKVLEWYAENMPHAGAITTRALTDKGFRARSILSRYKGETDAT